MTQKPTKSQPQPPLTLLSVTIRNHKYHPQEYDYVVRTPAPTPTPSEFFISPNSRLGQRLTILMINQPVINWAFPIILNMSAYDWEYLNGNNNNNNNG